MATFEHAGHRLAYTEHGTGDRPVVLVHGLLLSQKLVTPLARDLAGCGFRTVTLDVLGHGRSDRPRTMQAYSMTRFGEQIVGLLDHLGLEQAAVGGLSLGANAALEAAALAPERVRGLVIEMPVLDNALLACALAFTPLLGALTFGAPAMRAVARATRLLPTARGPWLADAMLDIVRQDPEPSAAILQGLFFHRIAPPTEVRRSLEQPALIIGHDRDPIHPFSDADALVGEMPNAHLVRARSILELRLSPDRLTHEIADFLDDLWHGRPRPSAAAERVA